MTSDKLSSVTRIIVAYNSAAVLPDCLDAIPGLASIVVDNDSHDTTRTFCRSRDEVRLIESPVNLGFGAGMNLGLKQCTTTYALLINPDAVLDAENLAILIETAEQYPEAGLIGPRIINADGSIEPSHDRAYHRRKGLARQRTDPPPEGTTCVEFLSGAVFLARTDMLRSIDGFDERFFLFYEDDDISWRTCAAGHPNLLVPLARAVHLGGQSTPPSARNTFRREFHMGRSLSIYLRKHESWGAAFRQLTTEGGKLFAKALLRSLIFDTVKASRDWGRLAGMINGMAA